jgi:hypothetical protein
MFSTLKFTLTFVEKGEGGKKSNQTYEESLKFFFNWKEKLFLYVGMLRNLKGLEVEGSE